MHVCSTLRQGRSTPSVTRVMMSLGLGASCLIAMIIPATYCVFSLYSQQKVIAVEAVAIARSLEEVVQGRPDLWDRQKLRLKELAASLSPQGVPDQVAILDILGKDVTRTETAANWPVLRATEPFHDASMPSGSVEVKRSIRSQLLATVLLGILSSLLGWLIHYACRTYPVRRIEDALSQLQCERERSDKILDAIGDGLISVDDNGRILTINPAAARLVGWPSGEALGRPLAEVYRLRSVTGSGEEETQNLLTDRGGKELIIEEARLPLSQEGCDLGGLVITFRDITAHQRMEQVLRLNREVATRLARELGVIAEIGRIISSTLDIDEVFDRFVAEVQKLIPADRLGISLHTLVEGAVTIAYVAGTAVPGRQKGDTFPLAGTFNEMLIRTRTGMLFHPDSPEALDATYPTLMSNYQAGMRSFMSVPLISRDEVIGILDFRTMQPNTYGPEDLSLAQRIGEQIAGAISGAQTFATLKKVERSLRDSEARFRPLFEQAAIGVAELDIRTGRYLTVNRRHCELLAMTEEELLSQTFQDVSHPEDRDLHVEKMADLRAGKIKNFTLEKRYIRKDGEAIWVNITVSPLWKTGETPDRNIAVVEDVSDRRQMQEEIERRSRQLAALHETSLHLTSELNLGTLLQSITGNALNLIGGMFCRCYLPIPGTELLERVAIAGMNLVADKVTLRRDEGLVGRVWTTGAPVLVDDYQAWPGHRQPAVPKPLRAMLGVPIRWGEEFLGVLNIGGERLHQYSQADVEVLGMFATQAAIAIRNARLYSRIEQLAVTDELTGLLNRRGFFQLGEREFERALRFKRPLAAVMFDIDHFKEVNDTHGHQAGDQVLRALADCVRQKTRGIDVTGRYGGEEFVLLMPETRLAETVRIAERLRRSVMALAIPVSQPGNGNPPVPLRITVSIGVAMQEEEVPNLDTLVDRADQAQYRAKRAGRNRVVVWERRDDLPPLT